MMKKLYRSLEELRSGCSSSALLVHVASTLSIRSHKGDRWNFVSAVEDGNEYYTEFDQPIENSDIVFYFSSHGSPDGHRGHISTTKPAPIETCVNF